MPIDPALATLLTHRTVVADGVRLHYVEAGPSAGPVIVMLHGFPESWYSWRKQIPPLAAAGYRVLAPDMRGVGDSDRPRATSAYTLDRLADDVAGVMRAAGVAHATIVGHDWGAAVAWRLAQRDRALVRRLVALNGPHPGRFAHALRDPRQLARSAYMLAFLAPGLPERLLAAGDFALLRRALTYGGVPGAFSDADIDHYRQGWLRPGALTGALAPYRALPSQLRAIRSARAGVPIAAPALVIWGKRDSYLRPSLADPGPAAAGSVRIERVVEAAHFVHADAPARVNALLLAFMRAGGDVYDPG